MEFKTPEIISLAVTGILSLLWWDIRNIRKDRAGAEEKQRRQREIDINTYHETFLKKTDHVVLCENAVLRFEQIVGKMIKESVVELKAEIKKNGGV